MHRTPSSALRVFGPREKINSTWRAWRQARTRPAYRCYTPSILYQIHAVVIYRHVCYWELRNSYLFTDLLSHTRLTFAFKTNISQLRNNKFVLVLHVFFLALWKINCVICLILSTHWFRSRFISGFLAFHFHMLAAHSDVWRKGRSAPELCLETKRLRHKNAVPLTSVMIYQAHICKGRHWEQPSRTHQTQVYLLTVQMFLCCASKVSLQRQFLT